MYLDNIVEGYSKRLLTFSAICLLIFTSLLIFLWDIQLKGGEEHRQKISKQSFRKMRLSPVRGRIFTEDNVIVADSKPTFDAVFHISEMRQPGKRVKTIEYVAQKVIATAAIIGRKADAVNKKNLDRIFQDSLSLDKYMFNNFWKKRQIERAEMFPNMKKDYVWANISENRYFADDFSNEVLKRIPLYRRFFTKLNKARSVSDRLYEHISKSKNKAPFIQSWLDIIEIRTNQMNKLQEKPQADLTQSEKQQIEHAKEVIAIPADDLSKVAIWKKLRKSWRWKKYGVLPQLSELELFDVIGQTYEEVVQITISNHISRTAAIPYKAFKDLDEKSLGAISEAMHTIPGLEIQINCQRDYEEPKFAAHILGITSSRIPQDYKEEKFFYSLPELTGRSGLEFTYDEELRGKPGQKVVQVDTSGYSHEVKKFVQAENGNELILNINSKAQNAAQQALESMFKREEKFGALVAIDVHTGAVKAIASYPTFSLKEFDYTELNEDEDKPLLNRAMSERYTPGSIVKPLAGLAALQTKAIEPDFTHVCNGYHYVNPEKSKGETKCWSWRTGGHGELDLFGAIEQSCNPFFNEVGIKTTFAELRRFFVQAGFGSKTGIDLKQSPLVLGESPGHLPTRESYKKETKTSWSSLTTAQFAMGQSDQGVTPLQAVCYTAAIANGGTVYKPRLVKEIRNSEGKFIRSIKPEVKSLIKADPLYFDLIKQGMHQVVWGDHASAKPARFRKYLKKQENGEWPAPPITLAGKTGTAQVGNNKQNTWFTCYGPEENPKYACTVLVINGSSGGGSAAPVATEFFQRWLGKEEN